MSTFNKSILTAIAVFSLLAVAPAQAGLLDSNPNAVGGFAGSVPFTSTNPALWGTVDYGVFTAATWDSLFGDVINVPQGGPASAPHDAVGPLVYAYQINNLGTDAISFDIQGNSQPGVTDIGYTDDTTIGTRAPTSAFFDVGLNANWSFIGNNILSGESSEFIVFSSNHAPTLSGTQIIVDGGTTAVAFGIAAPGPLTIPEPTGMILAAGCTALLSLYRRR